MDKEKIKLKLIFWYSILWILIFAALYLAYFVYFPDVTSTKSKWILLFSGAISILAFACKHFEISFYNIQSEVLKTILSVNKTFYRYKNALILFFLTLLYFIFYKHLNNSFIISTFCGVFLFLFSTKVTSKLALKGQIGLQDSKYLPSVILRQSFNSHSATSFLFWGLLSVGIVVLYHAFKDYEIITGYIFGISTAAFLEDIITLISKNSFLNADEILEKYNNSALKDIVQIFKVQNYSVFFETYMVALICAITIGANILGLMGSFIPIVASANIMFVSVILLLLSKKSKRFSTSKLSFKTMFLAAILSNIMLYFEVKYWLNTDFCAITYCALLGSIFGIITLYINKYKSLSSKIQKIKKEFSEIFNNIFILILLLSGVFMIADGLNSTLYGFYCIIISIIGYNSIAPIITTVNQDEQSENKTNNYIKNLTLLSFISIILTFMSVSQIHNVDILNPAILSVLFGGLMVIVVIVDIASNNISKQTRKITLVAKCKKNSINTQTIIRKSIYSSSACAFLAFIGLIILYYMILKHLSIDYLFALTTGICLSLIILLYKNDSFLSPIAKIIIKYIGVILISTPILFV